MTSKVTGEGADEEEEEVKKPIAIFASSGVARSSYRQHSCDDVMKLGLCDWFTN